jgi:hypothetical protein
MTAPQRITTALAVALALATSAGPGPALARPFDLNGNGSYVPVTAHSAHARIPAAASGTAARSPTIVRVTAPGRGFDWGDAGIGAAGGVALAAIGLGGALVLSEQRTRRAGPTKAMIS